MRMVVATASHMVWPNGWRGAIQRGRGSGFFTCMARKVGRVYDFSAFYEHATYVYYVCTRF